MKSRRYFVGRGLTRAAAYQRARRRAFSPLRRDYRRDWRGFTYNPRTGWASLT